MKIHRTILIEKERFQEDRFQNVSDEGRFLIKVRDYSDLANIKTVKQFRCDGYISDVVGDWQL